MNVTIVDYQSGNISSVINSFTEVAKGKVNLEVTSDINKIKSSDKIVLPGQGSFKSCVDSLNKINGLVDSVSAGSTGLLVEPQNVENFSKAMTFLLNNKRDRLLLGSNARSYAVEKFSQDKITSLYRKSVFQSLNLRTG